MYLRNTTNCYHLEVTENGKCKYLPTYRKRYVDKSYVHKDSTDIYHIYTQGST